MKRFVLSIFVLSLSATVFLGDYSSAKNADKDADPNVLALRTSLKSSQCYGHDDGKEYHCTKTDAPDVCVLCDDDLVITPPEPEQPPIEPVL
ncbi:hypothetical protein H8788_08300 [Parabacteroides faecis]|uniref:hypothetical protein n=1 Tax=Parabacteroides TaxID=375288 RepID=UPI000F0006FC|nr:MULTISPECIES: hypothetical protein [Parabacteroides]MBC8617734.1 hypothetical protein [Parabacteroides faecis]RHR96297.1 hypothetical protein DWW23_16355 [Parabacteroides sp. AF14-59]